MNLRRNKRLVICCPFFWKDDASPGVKVCSLKNLAKLEAT